MRAETRAAITDLCQTIRQTKDYSLLSVLADEIDKGGPTDDEGELALRLRDRPTAIEAQRLVALLYSDETAEAVRWIENFAASLNPDGYAGEGPQPDYEFCLRAAQRWRDHERYTTQRGGEDWREVSTPTLKQFWEHVACITGEKVPGDLRFFSCSC